MSGHYRMNIIVFLQTSLGTKKILLKLDTPMDIQQGQPVDITSKWMHRHETGAGAI